ncbi:hypothetical protein Patl1_06127 [Pistacia atlantica]|uniref:Uncharacterized protein n=1 Tax=Pistacia atlantica TaxID=434234 RepID=A0ACC1BTQ7_9ROSI|nr:hypothetical protein Patl1_06127 [Pistacia atlantica]
MIIFLLLNMFIIYLRFPLSSKPFLACMQVPLSSQLLREMPRNRQSVNHSDELYNQAPRHGEVAFGAEESSFGMFNMVNFQHPSSGIKFLKLKWRKFDRLASQVGGPKNVFCELFGDNKAENTFWLDSSSIEKGRARFSFMGGKGGSLWKQVTFRLSDPSDMDFKRGGHLSTEDARGSTKSSFLEEGFFDFLNKELVSFRYDENDYKGLPFDFHGGYVGYIGYNLKVECGVSFNRHKSRTPDACFFFADNLVVIDHYLDDVYILSLYEESTAMTPWLDDTEEKLINLKTSSIRNFEQTSQAAKLSLCKTAFVSDRSREHYIRDVKNCLNYIKDGESYELCLTTQFLRLDKNGILEAKPIKGTIARGSSREEDEKLKLQLQYSEKDQAENLMIVDLLRNDLGRVCEPGSVHVPRLMDVESYATVHTMVSTIRGKKLSNVSPVDCVRAAFPGGSMTGAPKLRSMELLDSIESCSRGIYSGSIGFFSYNRTFDLNIVIRTVIIHEGEASIGAGGAIVALSNPEDEYEEMILKTHAPAKAVMEFD